MISFEINGEKVTKLYLDGSVLQIYKELYTVVAETLEKLELHNETGERKPLEQVVLEFGQFLAMVATVKAADKDGEPHDKGTQS